MNIDIRLFAPIATSIACAISITITISLWWLNKQRKQLSIFTLRSEPLIGMKGIARRKLRVLFNDKPLESAHLLHLSLQNSGNVPVALGDYQSPVEIELNPDAEILEVDILETWPADLDKRISSNNPIKLVKNVSRSSVVLQPVLLNPHDEIVMQILVTNYSNYLNVSQHITGIKRIDPWVEPRMIPTALSILGAGIIFFAAFFIDPDTPFFLTLPSLPYIMLVSLGCLLYATGQVWPRSERARHFARSYVDQTTKTTAKAHISSEGT